MKKLIFSILLAAVGVSAIAQSNQTDTSRWGGAIQLTGKVIKGAVVLRWTPNTPGAWHLSNRSGYQIERCFLKGVMGFNPANFRPIHPEPIKPWPLEEWEAICPPKTENAHAAIAAQMIYGKNGDMDEGKSPLERSDIFQNRYSFTCLSADLSEPVARAAGLRYVDTDVDTGYTYVYRIYSLGSSPDYPIDTAYWAINMSEEAPLIRPRLDAALESDSMIQLQWDRAFHQAHFSAYFIERSEDGGRTFARLHNTPYLSSPLENDTEKFPVFVYNDSVPQNYKPYHYRLVGITPFAEEIAAEEILQAMARDKTPPSQPFNVVATATGTNQIRISWEFPAEAPDLAGFIVAHSNDPTGSPKPLHNDKLPPDTRSYIHIDAHPDSVNYYMVASVDTAGNAAISMVAFTSILDTIPPSPPMGLQGIIDTNGMVSLSWEANTERDIAGYQVFYSNDPEHFFTNRTNRIIPANSFSDTIMIRSLTKRIYYRVVAVDKHSNHSAFSEVLELKKPDVVQPDPPIFNDYEIGYGFFKLHWANSTHDDVVMYRIYKREKGQLEWALLSEGNVRGATDMLTDSLIMPGKTYEYRIESEDESGLVSKPTFLLALPALDFQKKPVVENLIALTNQETRNIQLRWSYPYAGNYHFVIYRAEEGGNFSTIKSITGDVAEYTDTSAKKGIQYEYAIKVFYQDGGRSAFSDYVTTKL
jgi:fibronectin type 3 domain-containing protein